MIFDSHAHLDDEQFDSDREELLQALPTEGVGFVMIPSVSLESSRKLLALLEQYDYLIGAVGIHPQELKLQEGPEDLLPLLKHPKIKAIGEIGLDYYWTKDDHEEQKALFRAQLELAKAHKLPVLIHDREAHEDVMRLLDEVGSYETGVVLHSYSGSVEMAREYLKKGAYISLSGTVTFKNARVPREVAQMVPLDRLLVETDAPYLTPEPFRGKRNDPSKVRYIIEKIAVIKGLNPEEVEQATFENGRRLLCLQ